MSEELDQTSIGVSKPREPEAKSFKDQKEIYARRAAMADLVIDKEENQATIKKVGASAD